VVSPDAFGGWRVVWREMDQAGVPPERLQALVSTGFPMDTVITALREGRADAGVLRTCLLEEEIAAGRVRPDEFAVVAEQPASGFPCRLSSRLYPDWPFARLAGTSPDLAKAVTAALLTMPPVDGRAWTAPQDYTSVHALFRELRIGPYAYLGHTTLGGILREHWPWFVFSALAVLWWVFVVRVETLVRRRTAELTRAIEGREAAERAARQHREERDQFSRLGILGEMASNIAHELNQPLAAITNYAEGITRVIDAGRIDPAFIRNGARGIAGQAERAGVIIRRIRGFVRRREVQRELGHQRRGARDPGLFEGQARLRGAADRGPGRGPAAHQRRPDRDRAGAAQPAAERAGRDGGQPDKARHHRDHAPPENDSVEVAVRDHGTGLTPEVQAHLFDPFFTTKPQGLGLGLSICRTIVESHGGHLWATNEPDGGLSMRLPCPSSRRTAPHEFRHAPAEAEPR
jgi:two-component system sensor histidine kinase TtrS